jgi:multicomponent Na+:H+ antiporter subunit D
MIWWSAAFNLQLAMALPLISCFGIRLLKNAPNMREAVSLSTAAGVVMLIYHLYDNVASTTNLKLNWFELLPGLSLSFTVDPLGLLFALVSSFLWLVTCIYSIGYMRARQEQQQTRFYQCFALAMASVLGIAFAANLFTLYVYYELLTLATFPLVAHAGHEKARRGGQLYLAILLVTSILFFLPAIVATWLISGSLDFTPQGLLNQTLVSTHAAIVIPLTLLLPLFVFGIGKAAIFPFHGWLPAAMVAPTPVSALLHAVAVVNAGVYTVLKICLFIFGLDLVNRLASSQFMLYLAGFSVLLSSIMALYQDNLKKRLAYSTISQLGYVLIGALLANNAGIIGAAMHMAMHAFAKITLFFCAGAILVASNKTKVSELHGLGRQMPMTMLAFLIGSLSIIGLPPTAGMWSKWFLLQGALMAEQWLLIIVLALSSVMNLFYLLSIPIRAFWPDPERTSADELRVNEPFSMRLAIAICAAGCVLLFFYPQPLYQLAATIITSAGP